MYTGYYICEDGTTGYKAAFNKQQQAGRKIITRKKKESITQHPLEAQQLKAFTNHWRLKSSVQSPLVQERDDRGAGTEAVEIAGPCVGQTIDHDVRENTGGTVLGLTELVQHIAISERSGSVAGVTVETGPLLDVSWDGRQALTVVRASSVANLSVGVAVDLEERDVGTARRTGHADGGRDTVGIVAAGVESTGVGSKGGDLGAHDGVAGKSAGEASSVRHTSSVDASSVDAVGRCKVGEELVDEGNIIHARRGVRGALPVVVDT